MHMVEENNFKKTSKCGADGKWRAKPKCHELELEESHCDKLLSGCFVTVADLCTLRILPYVVRNSTQNTEIRICYFGYGNAHLLNTETLMVT